MKNTDPLAQTAKAAGAALRAAGHGAHVPD